MAVTFGIDISHHQASNPNLKLARGEGIEFCIMKAGEGSNFVDSKFAARLSEARAAGMLVAAYWYQRSNASAAAHVAKIKQIVPKTVPVIPDVEANSGGVDLTREIVRLLRAEGYKVPFVYIPRWYWQQIGSPSLAGLPPLWSSRYPDNNIGGLGSEWAVVPASYWNGYGGLDVVMLQFTSSARIAGYAPLDANAFRGTREQLAALFGGQSPEENMALTQADAATIFWGTPFDGANNFAQYLKSHIDDLTARLARLEAAQKAPAPVNVDASQVAAEVVAQIKGLDFGVKE